MTLSGLPAFPPGRRRPGRSRGAATSSHFGSSRFRRTAWSRLPPPSAPAVPQRPHSRSPPASSSRTTSATPARTRTRTRSRTRRSRRSSFRPAPGPSPAACTTTATRAACSRSNPSSPTSDIAKQGWTVTLQRKTGATTYTTVDSDSSDANGMYSVAGPIGSDFRLCVTAPAPDSSSSWGVRAVTGVTRVDGCAPISPTSDAAKAGLSVLNLSSAGATGQDFAVVPITTPNFDAGDTATDRELHRHGRRQFEQGPAALRAGDVDRQTATRTSCSRRSTPARVAPARSTCSSRCPARSCRAISGRPTRSCSSTTTPSPSRRSCRCRTASRILACAGNILLEDGVLPAGATSCIVEGHQTAVGDGTVANASVDFTFFVYTSYDGSRGGPNPAALAVIADALHEALCLLQRVGGIRLPTLQLGERCEGP